MYFSGEVGTSEFGLARQPLVLPDFAPAESGRLLKAKMQRVLLVKELRGSE